MPGFSTSIFNLNYDANQPSLYSFPLSVADINETVEVSARGRSNAVAPSVIGGPLRATDLTVDGRISGDLPVGSPVAQQNASANVINLQKTSGWGIAGADGCAARGDFVRLRAAAGARRGDQGDFQLQEPMKS